jgi:hypothetical protein
MGQVVAVVTTGLSLTAWENKGSCLTDKDPNEIRSTTSSLDNEITNIVKMWQMYSKMKYLDVQK